MMLRHFQKGIITALLAILALLAPVQAQTITEQVQEIYVAYYGRPADPAGLTYWEQQLTNNNGDLTAIINQFGNSSEYTDRFASLSNQQLINNIYLNLLGRDADATGAAFYLERLQSGAMTLGTIALNIADGVQVGSADAGIINDKIAVASAYTTAVTANNATYGSAQINAAVSLISSVDGTQGSVDTALTTVTTLTAGSTTTVPALSIVANANPGFTAFSRRVDVFDIPIYAVEGVADNKLLHAANIMAQYLDNNEDGVIDNPVIWNSMLANKAFLFMWKTEADMESFDPPDGYAGQDLGADETVPGWHTNGYTGRFDAALEEVFHLITANGHAKAYPAVFGESQGTTLTLAMDKARGGQFTSIPNPYPAGAWYTYDDTTCDYRCMATEYVYWAMTSLLGAQSNRLSEIQQEWTLNTPALLQSGDPDVYQLLTNTEYKLPTVLPDGSYGN